MNQVTWAYWITVWSQMSDPNKFATLINVYRLQLKNIWNTLINTLIIKRLHSIDISTDFCVCIFEDLSKKLWLVSLFQKSHFILLMENNIKMFKSIINFDMELIFFFWKIRSKRNFTNWYLYVEIDLIFKRNFD